MFVKYSVLFPLQDAEKLLNDENLSIHSKLCIQLKLTEQRILKNSIAFCQSQKERAQELEDNATSYLGEDLDGAVDVEELDVCCQTARLIKPRGPVALATEEDTQLDDEDDNDDIPTTSSTSLSTTTKDTESIPEMSDESVTDSRNGTDNDADAGEHVEINGDVDKVIPNGNHENGDLNGDSELDENGVSEVGSKLNGLHLEGDDLKTKATKDRSSCGNSVETSVGNGIGTNGVTVNGGLNGDQNGEPEE